MVVRKAGIVLAALAGAVTLFTFLAVRTPSLEGWVAKKVYVPKGSGFRQVARLLEEGGVLAHPLVFRLLVLATGKGRLLQYGEYHFPAPPSALDVWRKIVTGDVTKFYVTIPEGSTLEEIAKILGDLGLVDPAAFLDRARSREGLRKLGIEGESAEGFLFPETYLFVKHMAEEEILEAMVARFRAEFTPEMQAAAARAGFSVRQIVTIASIIEKETGVEAEKPVISAIVRNRMALGMRLQMDPTVIYGLKKFGQPLVKSDLKTPNPYNTYRSRGLPPGPIANPGRSALRAALFPAGTNYLYFVSRNDGSHAFSRTLEEHIRSVASYRKGADGN